MSKLKSRRVWAKRKPRLLYKCTHVYTVWLHLCKLMYTILYMCIIFQVQTHVNVFILQLEMRSLSKQNVFCTCLDFNLDVDGTVGSRPKTGLPWPACSRSVWGVQQAGFKQPVAGLLHNRPAISLITYS